jgi:hypothetical protein
LVRQEKAVTMRSRVKSVIVHAWKLVFDPNVSPVRHIPDPGVRVFILQWLALMWAVCMWVALGSYTVFAVSIIGHIFLIAAAAITAATLTAATKRPSLFMRGSRPSTDSDQN